ncbi:MAG: acyl-CoA synthetase [Marinosulfonomonas sp.]|nr:acyl-CoA synthetase [Marinosulfonomonas sp.]
MARFATVADRDAIENEMPWADQPVPKTMYGFMADVVARHGDRNALTFQLLSGPTDKAETLTWRQFNDKSVQAANLFRSLGIGEKDAVAYILPNCNEIAITMIGGTIAGIASPINPLLEPEQIAAILREIGAKVVVTLRSFPKTDVAQKVAQALALVPEVETVLEVDLLRYLTPPKSWIVPLLRPKNPVAHSARTLSFNAELAKQSTTLDFADSPGDRVAAYFHTGGTTGMPKVAQHKYSGMIYNGWLGKTLLFTEDDTVMCPLPLFHVFACHVILMAMIASGAHMISPTPAGYRGDGVFANMWKLVERWKVSFIIIVPTAISALMQRSVDADISSLKTVFSGSSPLPVELYKRFEQATKVAVIEGYGLTEATCLVACNPLDGPKKIGSVGIPFPYTDVKILNCAPDGAVINELGPEEVGEICVSNPGVFVGHTYSENEKNSGLFAQERFLRTGDLGRLDGDGYLWITGRSKDLIIRGGHNIDPAEIEEALAGHEAVAFVGAIGQPDSFAGELPCAYVELIEGAKVSVEELMEFAVAHVQERAAHPKYIEILPELPKTAVGKIFKPELRKLAITRVYNQALEAAGLAAKVVSVLDDKHRGLLAQLSRTGTVDDVAVTKVLGEFTRPWKWTDDS